MSLSKKIKHSKKDNTQTLESISTANPVGSNTIAIAISIIAILLYLGTIGHGFVLDDALVTTINSYVQKGFGGFWDILTHSYRAGASITTDSDYMYRPLSVLMFAIEWALFPNQAWIHHLLNILLYGVTIYFLFYTCLNLLGQKNRNLVLGICLLFALHPIHTEVVSNIKSRDEILSFLFGILSLYSILKAYDGKPKAMLWACLFFFFSLLSKEGAITMLFIIPLCIYFFRNENPLKYLLPLFLVFISWFLLRYSVMGSPHYIPNVNDNQLVSLGMSERWATAFFVLLQYLKILVWPIHLSWDYSYNQIPNQTWWNYTPILSLLLYLGLTYFAITKLKQKSIFSFCILAFIISMGLYSNLFFLLGTLMGDRLAYQSSLWFCIAMVFLMAKIVHFEEDATTILKGKNSVLFFSLIAGIGLVFFYLSFQRSKDWRSSYDLFLADVNHAPNSFRAYQAIADESLQLYMKKYQNPMDSIKYLTQAEKFYEASGLIKKTFSNQVGLGNTSLFQKNFEKAIQSFENAKSLIANTVIEERLTTAYYQYGRQEAQVNNNLVRAQELLENAYKRDSSRVEIIGDLGMVYGLSKQFEKALFLFEKAYQLNPNDEFIIGNLANTYVFVGQQAKADLLFNKLKK